MREDFTSGLFRLQRKHLACEYFLTACFSWGGDVSASPNPQAGGPPLVGCPRLFIQFIRCHPPYRRPFLHPQPEDAPCPGDRDPQTRLSTHWKLKYTRSQIPFVSRLLVFLDVEFRFLREWDIRHQGG